MALAALVNSGTTSKRSPTEAPSPQVERAGGLSSGQPDRRRVAPPVKAQFERAAPGECRALPLA